MKKILLASAMALVAAAGCQDQKKPTTGASALDLTPTPATPVYTAPAPAPVQPVTYDVSTPSATVTPVAMTTSGSGTYTVKKGDTLYGIAKKHYGDGKQWSKIASANPGLSPSSLKVGQTITLP